MVIRRPAGYSSDEDDFDEFCDFDVSTSKSVPNTSLVGYGLGTSREITDKKISDMERLKGCISMYEVTELTQILSESKDLDVNSEFDSMTWTPLLYASSMAAAEVVYELLIFGANPNLHKDSYTPLMAACSCDTASPENVLKCIQYLLLYGANAKASDRHGMTPLMFAALHGHSEVVTLLVPQSDIEAEDSQGWTALFFAANGGHINIVEHLAGMTLDLGKCDVRGGTAKHVAMEKGYMEIADLLTDPNEVKLVTLEEINDCKPPIWEDLFPGIQKKDPTPAYFDDVRAFLYGVSLARYIPAFQLHKLGFPQMLSATDGQFESMGMHLPFDRRRLLHAIHKFHGHKWSRKSISPIPKDLFSVYDVLYNLGSTNKHISIMSSTLKYANNRLKEKKKEKKLIIKANQNKVEANSKLIAEIDKFGTEKVAILTEVKKLKERIHSMKSTLKRLNKAVSKVEKNTTPPADYITASNFKITRFCLSKRLLYYGLFTVSAMYLVKKQCFVTKLSKTLPNLFSSCSKYILSLT